MNMFTIEKQKSVKTHVKMRHLAAALIAVGIHADANALQFDSGVVPILNKTDAVLQLNRVVYSSKFTCGIFGEGKTFAQVNKGLGSAPPLGKDHSSVALLPDRQDNYYDFQPGTYSTALNIFNPTKNSLNIDVKVSSENIASSATVARITIPSFNSARIGCRDIEVILPEYFKGELIDGFLHITRFNSDIQVQAIYTYTSIGAFQEFRGGFVDGAGVIPGDLITVFPADAGAGAGAGGLGLGASVDVETLQPIIVQ